MIAAALLAAGGASVAAQGWMAQPVPTTASLRGLSVPSDSVVWASGTGGTVVRTTDGGASWQVVRVPGADSLDFRDIEAFDGQTAFVLSIGNGALSRIYVTRDGGATWSLQFRNADSSAFYDCFAFWSRERGIAMSDPVRETFRLLSTVDGGATWRVHDDHASPRALAGEAGFAASGTCTVAGAGGRAWIVTGGGPRARILRSADFGRTWSAHDLSPIAAEAPPRGAFSVADAGGRTLVATGGNYERPADSSFTVALSGDDGVTWRAPRGTLPRGYRSGVAAIAGAPRILVAVGTTGTDYSLDGGDNWIAADTVALNAVAFASASSGWAVGPRGRVVRWRGAFPAPALPVTGKERRR